MLTGAAPVMLSVRPMTLPEIIRVLQREHQCAPPASDAQLRSAQQHGLPEDLLSFYALANGATLFRTRPGRNSRTGAPRAIPFEFIIPTN